MLKFDHVAFKQQFPLFSQPANQALTYFDNAATTQKPQVVIDAIVNFYLTQNSNANRASHRLARQATAVLEQTRTKLAHWLGGHHSEIVFTRGATESLNLVAFGLAPTLQAGDMILISRAEHHANFLPWQRLCAQHKLDLVLIPDHDGVPDISAIPKLLSARTKIVALTLASNLLGCRLRLETIATTLAAHPASVVIDATQALAHEQLDVQALGCDFLVGSAHKCYGPLGIGFLYGRKTKLSMLEPMQLGGDMVNTVSVTTASFAPSPHRFEAGTLALGDIAAFGACIDFLQQQNRAAMRTHETSLLHLLHCELSQICTLRMISKPEHNIGIVAFVLDPPQALRATVLPDLSDLALWLDEHDIAVRVGSHCAQPLCQYLGIEQVLRLSIAAYNNEVDCYRAIAAIKHWLALFYDLTPAAPQQRASVAMRPATVIDVNNIETIEPLYRAHNWQTRYRALLQLGSQLPLQPNLQQAEYLLTGCETRTWIAHNCCEGKHFFAIESASKVNRGLGAIILYWFNGKTYQTMLALDWQAECERLELTRHLSASRANGLKLLVHRALELARVANEADVEPPADSLP